MNKVLENGLKSIIDYAGYFPPAKLPLNSAFEEYMSLNGVKREITAKFVLPCHELAEFSGIFLDFPIEAPIQIAVVGSAGGSLDEWETRLEQDAKRMHRFQIECPDAIIAAYESKIPGAFDLEACIKDLSGFQDADLFLEVPWRDPNGEPHFLDAIEFAADLQNEFDFSLKARTGGVEPQAYPSIPDVSAWIHRASQLEVAYKFTAGLHEPVSHIVAPDFSTIALGFLNVLISVAACLKEDLLSREIEEILQDTSMQCLKVSDLNLTYNDFELNSQDIIDAREHFICFGSCSIDEPIEGLRKLNLIGIEELATGKVLK